MPELEDVASAFLMHWLAVVVEGEGQTDPVRLKSSSQNRALQAVSKWPADSPVCLSEVSSSFLVSPPSAG